MYIYIIRSDNDTSVLLLGTLCDCVFCLLLIVELQSVRFVGRQTPLITSSLHPKRDIGPIKRVNKPFFPRNL